MQQEINTDEQARAALNSENFGVLILAEANKRNMVEGFLPRLLTLVDKVPETGITFVEDSLYPLTIDKNSDGFSDKTILEEVSLELQEFVTTNGERFLFRKLLNLLKQEQCEGAPESQFGHASIDTLVSLLDPLNADHLLVSGDLFQLFLSNSVFRSKWAPAPPGEQALRNMGLTNSEIGYYYDVVMLSDAYRHPNSKSLAKDEVWAFNDTLGSLVVMDSIPTRTEDENYIYLEFRRTIKITINNLKAFAVFHVDFSEQQTSQERAFSALTSNL